LYTRVRTRDEIGEKLGACRCCTVPMPTRAAGERRLSFSMTREPQAECFLCCGQPGLRDARHDAARPHGDERRPLRKSDDGREPGDRDGAAGAVCLSTLDLMRSVLDKFFDLDWSRRHERGARVTSRLRAALVTSRQRRHGKTR